MGVTRKPRILKHSETQTLCSSLTMDLYTLIPRTLVGVVYPAFMSLKSVLHGSPETATAWMRYWVVLGVFSLLELLLDPVVNPISYSFPPSWLSSVCSWSGACCPSPGTAPTSSSTRFFSHFSKSTTRKLRIKQRKQSSHLKTSSETCLRVTKKRMAKRRKMANLRQLIS